MRQGLAFILSIMLLGITIPGKEVQSKETYQTIPDDAIRLRILANSDEEADQHIKHMVRDEVNQYISTLVAEMDDIDVARETIQAKLPKLEEIVATTLEKAGVEEDFSVDYGKNVNFPTKVYDHYVYPAGNYEAILITLGEGQGANWWCVLFPPLCFLDFSDGGLVEDDEVDESEENENTTSDEDTTTENDAVEDEDVEVSFFLLDWLGWS